MAVEALRYRPWRQPLRPAALRFWPIARSGLQLIFKRKLFWIFLLLGLLNFIFSFAVIYFFTQLASQMKLSRGDLPRFLRVVEYTDPGNGYLLFIQSQNFVVMLLLAFAASLVVGSDFRSGALAFYLSKPIGKLHYALGKFLPVFGVGLLVTLVPALALFVEYGAFEGSLDYWLGHPRILVAIISSSVIASAASALLILAIASLCKRPVPILLVWGAVFVFLPGVGKALREIHSAWEWDLLSFWAVNGWIASCIFGVEKPEDPSAYLQRLPWALGVLGAVMIASAVTFWSRIRAMEIVR